jgi:hypothetical protein
MAYVSYTGLPVYFGDSVNSYTFPSNQVDANSKGVLAQQVTLSHTPNIAPQRLLGTKPDDDSYILAGPPNATLSISCLIDGESEQFNPFAYTGDVGDKGTTFRIGDHNHGISGSGAFLQSLSFTVAPYSPVSVQAEFALYCPLIKDSLKTGGKLHNVSNTTTQSAIPNLDQSIFAHGAYSTIQGKSLLTGIDNVESIQYNFSCNRLPVYELGSQSPAAVEYVSAEDSFVVNGDNVSQLVNEKGLALDNDFGVTLKNAQGTTVKILTGNYRVTAQNVSLAAGDFGRGSVTLSRVLK